MTIHPLAKHKKIINVRKGLAALRKRHTYLPDEDKGVLLPRKVSEVFRKFQMKKWDFRFKNIKNTESQKMTFKSL